MRFGLICFNIFILLFKTMNGNFFTYGIRKILGITIGTCGMKDATLNGKGSSQSSNLSSHLLLDKNKYESIKEKYLEARIYGFAIGLIPLGINFSFDQNIYGFIKNGFGTRAYLPCYLGGCTFNHHALGLVDTNLGYFIIEYGAYQGQDPQYRDYTFYYKGDSGARFIPSSLDEFEKIVTANGSYTYSDRLIRTTVKKQMKLGNLFKKISNEMNIRFEDYNVADNNCQDFIANAIKVLNGKRTDKMDSKMHNFAKLHIPPKILEALEDNEDYQILTSLGKIPILGVLTDTLGSIIVD